MYIIPKFKKYKSFPLHTFSVKYPCECIFTNCELIQLPFDSDQRVSRIRRQISTVSR